MKIIVCIKQVPDTTEIKIDPVTNTLKRDGVPSIINPDDKAALEAALVLKEKFDAHITVLCMGPPQAEKALGEAYAMGADRLILLSGREFAGSDTLATSRTLAAAIRNLEYDIIIGGRQAIDGDTAQVGPQISEHLGIPQITYATDISYDAGKGIFTVVRQMEDRLQTVEAPSPVLVTVLSSMNKPRYMNVRRIVEVIHPEVWGVKDIEIPAEYLGLKGSPTKVNTTFTKSYNTDKKVLEVDAATAADLIIDTIKSKHLIKE